MLTVQYRMHPLIRDFPSRTYYDGAITEGQSVLDRQLSPEIEQLSDYVRRSVFIDLVDSQEQCH